MTALRDSHADMRLIVPLDAEVVPRDGLVNSIQKLVAGNGLAQALQFGAVLILSRLYLPSDFGALAKMQSLASVLAIVATLQLHLSIPLSRSNQDVTQRVSAVETIGIAWGALALVLSGAGFGAVALAIVLALILGAANTFGSVLVFRGNFTALSLFSVLRATLTITLQLVCAAFGVKHGLLIGAFAGESLSALLMRRRAVGFLHIPAINFSRARETVRSLSAFTLFGTTQELISVASFYAPVFLFASVSGPAIGGQYAMANRLVFAPVVLLSGSTAQVLYHRFGKDSQAGVRALKFLRPNAWLAGAFVACCAAPFFLEDVFLRVLGAKWVLASHLIPMQVLWGAVFLLSTPARVLCRMKQMQRVQMSVDAAALAAIGLAFVCYPTTPSGTMWRLVSVAVTQNTVLVVAVLSALRAPLKGG